MLFDTIGFVVFDFFLFFILDSLQLIITIIITIFDFYFCFNTKGIYIVYIPRSLVVLNPSAALMLTKTTARTTYSTRNHLSIEFKRRCKHLNEIIFDRFRFWIFYFLFFWFWFFFSFFNFFVRNVIGWIYFQWVFVQSITFFGGYFSVINRIVAYGNPTLATRKLFLFFIHFSNSFIEIACCQRRNDLHFRFLHPNSGDLFRWKEAAS